ncbi:hypothetical protein AeRB84_012739, partial [Aphanomyces euteiches]
MASVREVWYVLVYSQANLSSADTVLIPPNSHVVRFRDAVHAKNTAILPGIVPLQLEVVTNKAAFGGKDDPLDPGAEIGEQLGKLEDKLFVVVPAEAYPTKRMKTMSPQPRQEWFTSELTVFCSIELSSDEWLAMKYGGMFQNLSLNDKGMEDNEPSNESMTSGSDMRDFQTFDMHFPVLMGHSGEASVFVRPCYEELFKLL